MPFWVGCVERLSLNDETLHQLVKDQALVVQVVNKRWIVSAIKERGITRKKRERFNEAGHRGDYG
jgi:hypothetical protein